jgi:hypothetical protein
LYNPGPVASFSDEDDVSIPGGRRVWRYQRDNHNPSIEEEQTTQWPREKSTKGQTTIYKTCI